MNGIEEKGTDETSELDENGIDGREQDGEVEWLNNLC